MLQKLAQALLLVLVQGFVLNHVSILGYATPMPYLYVLLTFQQGTGRKTLLLWGFLLGIVCDTFTNTPGISAASCTLLTFIQPRLLWMHSTRDNAEELQPSFSSMGTFMFTRYMLTGTIVHQCVYYLLLVFSLTHPADIGINIVGGTLFTLILMLGFAAFHRKKP